MRDGNPDTLPNSDHALLENEAAIWAWIRRPHNREGLAGGFVKGKPFERLHGDGTALGSVDDALYLSKNRHLPFGLADDLHATDRLFYESVQRKEGEDRTRCFGQTATRQIDERSIGCPGGDRRGGMVDVTDNEIITMPHEHEYVEKLGMNDWVYSL